LSPLLAIYTAFSKIPFLVKGLSITFANGAAAGFGGGASASVDVGAPKSTEEALESPVGGGAGGVSLGASTLATSAPVVFSGILAACTSSSVLVSPSVPSESSATLFSDSSSADALSSAAASSPSSFEPLEEQLLKKSDVLKHNSKIKILFAIHLSSFRRNLCSFLNLHDIYYFPQWTWSTKSEKQDFH
jgi:hypothetical protein